MDGFGMPFLRHGSKPAVSALLSREVWRDAVPPRTLFFFVVWKRRSASRPRKGRFFWGGEAAPKPHPLSLAERKNENRSNDKRLAAAYDTTFAGEQCVSKPTLELSCWLEI